MLVELARVAELERRELVGSLAAEQWHRGVVEEAEARLVNAFGARLAPATDGCAPAPAPMYTIRNV